MATPGASFSIGGGRSLGLSGAGLMAAMGIQKAAREALLDAALVLQREWTKIFPASGSGRVYTHQLVTVRGKGGARVVPIRPRKGAGMSASHQASRHPEAPAVDTGLLRSSIQIDAGSGANEVRVGTGLKYAKFLEYGVGPGWRFGPHPAGIEIKPRPHARPAAHIAEKKMGDVVLSRLRTGVRPGR